MAEAKKPQVEITDGVGTVIGEAFQTSLVQVPVAPGGKRAADGTLRSWYRYFAQMMREHKIWVEREVKDGVSLGFWHSVHSYEWVELNSKQFDELEEKERQALTERRKQKVIHLPGGGKKIVGSA